MQGCNKFGHVRSCSVLHLRLRWLPGEHWSWQRGIAQPRYAPLGKPGMGLSFGVERFKANECSSHGDSCCEKAAGAWKLGLRARQNFTSHTLYLYSGLT